MLKPSLSSKHKHLTAEDRQCIQEMLNKKFAFREIAEVLHKDPSTISKEVKKHITLPENSLTRRNEQGEIVVAACPLLAKPPYVCNECRKRHHCTCQRQLYSAKHAHNEYLDTFSTSRQGVPLSKESFYELDAIITTGLKKGQHLYQIIHSNQIDVPLSTIYRYFSMGYFSASAMDLPRKVKFKPRKKHYPDYVPHGVKVNRTYEDFLKYIAENQISEWVEMDTVIGRIGGKVILALDFTCCNFMCFYLLESKSACSVVNKFRELRQMFLDAGLTFKSCFLLILADNGGEFACIDNIERDLDGNVETRLFFCDLRTILRVSFSVQ